MSSLKFVACEMHLILAKIVLRLHSEPRRRTLDQMIGFGTRVLGSDRGLRASRVMPTR